MQNDSFAQKQIERMAKARSEKKRVDQNSRVGIILTEKK